MRLVIGETRPTTSLVANEILRQQLRALTGAERRLVEAVLIHKHRARLSPRESWPLAVCCTVSSRQRPLNFSNDLKGGARFAPPHSSPRLIHAPQVVNNP